MRARIVASPAAVLSVVLVASVPGTAWAGMPSFDLTDAAQLRVRAISFFAVVLLASAAAIQRIWNGVRTDFAFPAATDTGDRFFFANQTGQIFYTTAGAFRVDRGTCEAPRGLLPLGK